MTAQLRTFSYGGGVQSTTALVLAAQQKIDFPIFLFANVGEDSEHPKTLTYVDQIAKPYATANGIELIELRKTTRGEPETIMQQMKRRPKSLPIPVRMSNGAPGRRSCTSDYKIEVISKWQRQHGATTEAPAVCGLGISVDEIHRARTDSRIAHQTLEYPLIDLGMSRRDCIAVIEAAGLPVPPKSSCYFCPFHSRGEWQRMKREEPDLFQKSVELENMLNENRAALGKDRIYLHASTTPLAVAVGDQMHLWDGNSLDTDACESGYCFI